MSESTFSCCAYCLKNETTWNQLLHFKCDGCNKRVHYECLKSSPPSTLLDDTFFTFKCEGCAEDGKEDFNRMRLSWQDAVALCVYHLQKTCQGKCGFFHWRGNICAIIDANWRCLFGLHRKRSNLWHGTVAGTLSSNCPNVFTSGASAVDMGYWKLTDLKPPTPYAEKKKSAPRKRVTDATPVYLNPEERRARLPKESPLLAAMELKQKKDASLSDTKARSKSKTKGSQDSAGDSKQSRKKQTQGSKKRKTNPATERELDTLPAADHNTVVTTEFNVERSCRFDPEDSSSLASSFHSQNSQDTAGMRLDFLNVIKVEAEDDDDDLDIDIDSLTALEDFPDYRPESPDVSTALRCVSDLSEKSGSQDNTIAGKSPVKQSHFEIPKSADGEIQIKQEIPDALQSDALGAGDERDLEESDGPEEDEEEADEETGSGESDSGESGSGSDDDDGSEGENKEEGEKYESYAPDAPRRKRGRPRKRRRSSDAPPPSPPQRLKRISVFEERELLQRLNDAAKRQPLRPELAQLRRKLICNQTNREFSLPVFDLDKQLENLTRDHNPTKTLDRFEGGAFFPKLPTSSATGKETRDLDRFMIHETAAKTMCRTYTTFQQRLVGFDDQELKPFVSPYTTRVLLPFIWRNYNPIKNPLKLKLLQEIQAYPHRNDPTWKAPSPPPIDFCYVRPEHIPSVNALCREFFWPGIDMSECLQYPDFSCVVLYRKIVIGFAFMVPDRGYNEAYISFVFTHPEWRGVGIATFMIYHLIQTCMGKDVLLHVSASNSAMLLYQRFGFKAQELIKNFYYKYFPFDCKDSTHAFLMRLTR